MPVDRICFTALVGVGPKGNSIFVDMDFPRNSSTPELAAMLLTLIQDAEENFCRMQAAFADEPQFMIDVAQAVKEIAIGRYRRRTSGE